MQIKNVLYEIWCKKKGNNNKDLSWLLLIAECRLGNQPSIEKQQQYASIKDKLKEIEIEISNGAILQSKAKWIREGEKYTKYFFDLEKRNNIKKQCEH